MSRKAEGRHGPAPSRVGPARERGDQARPGGKGPPRGRRRWLWAIGGTVAAAVVAVWWVSTRVAEPPQAAAAPWERLAPRAAYEAGVEIMQSGRDLESLPYLRHAYVGTRGQVWEVPYAIYCALRNATFEYRELSGATVSATRSSVERVQMTKEALFYLTQAERLATRPRDIAKMRNLRAETLHLWGCSWDAFVNYRDAHAADSSWDEPARMGDALFMRMEHPEAPVNAR